jgi:hypothetical protein
VRFYELHQVFRVAHFFAAIWFQIFFMNLAFLTVALCNSVAPVLIVLTFMAGA